MRILLKSRRFDKICRASGPQYSFQFEPSMVVLSYWKIIFRQKIGISETRASQNPKVDRGSWKSGRTYTGISTSRILHMRGVNQTEAQGLTDLGHVWRGHRPGFFVLPLKTSSFAGAHRYRATMWLITVPKAGNPSHHVVHHVVTRKNRFHPTAHKRRKYHKIIFGIVPCPCPVHNFHYRWTQRLLPSLASKSALLACLMIEAISFQPARPECLQDNCPSDAFFSSHLLAFPVVQRTVQIYTWLVRSYSGRSWS